MSTMDNGSMQSLISHILNSFVTHNVLGLLEWCALFPEHSFNFFYKLFGVPLLQLSFGVLTCKKFMYSLFSNRNIISKHIKCLCEISCCLINLQ